MARLVAAAVWRARPDLIVALDDRFGEPVDAYVNGSQVWLREDGPGGVTLEWRLHPVARYRRPESTGTYEVFAAAALALATGAPPPAPLAELWDGLEAFAAYGDDLEPQPLARGRHRGPRHRTRRLRARRPRDDRGRMGAHRRGGVDRRRPPAPARSPGGDDAGAASRITREPRAHRISETVRSAGLR